MAITDLSHLRDDDLRVALFAAVVDRFDQKAREDPSVAIVNRMPSVLAVSRRGTSLTLSQGRGLSLLRGDLKWRDQSEQPQSFTVRRATLYSRLVIMPDGLEGTPDEILDRIILMLLEGTGAGPQRGPTPEPARDRQPALSGGGRPEAAVVPPQPLASVDRPAPPSESPGRGVAARPSAEPIREQTAPRLRSYQLLYQTARRELAGANAQPADRTSFLIGAGVFAGLAAEAFLNDLGSRVMPAWPQLQRLDPREKAEVLSLELFKTTVDWSVRPFSSVAAALEFRRALAHAHDDAGSPNDPATVHRWITDVDRFIAHFADGQEPSPRT